MIERKAIDISVYMLTYFHEKYICQAIDSVLSQKTKYSFEIVICDDCSTDKTRLIVEEYCKKYPDIIRAYFNETNIGIPKNIYKARCLCRGKYIVALSGDDYWIKEDKIELQADFLENHSNYIAVGNVMELRYDDEKVAFDVLPKCNERNIPFTLKDYENGKTFYSHGFMMRNLFLSKEGRDYFKKAQEISSIVDDAVDNVLILNRGDIFVMNIITDVYRVPLSKDNRNNYNSKYNRKQKITHSIEILNNLYNLFDGSIDLRSKYISIIPSLICSSILDWKYAEYKNLYNKIPSIYRYPVYRSVLFQAFPELIKFIFKRLELIVKKSIGR